MAEPQKQPEWFARVTQHVRENMERTQRGEQPVPLQPELAREYFAKLAGLTAKQKKQILDGDFAGLPQ